MGHRSKKAAFSLIELILVMMIIGILAAITTPKVFDLLESINEKAVSDRLVEDLTFIKNYAISHHDTTWLVVSVAQNQYGLYVGPSSGTRTLIPDPHTGISSMLDLDDEYQDVSITDVDFGGSDEVFFNFWGVPSSGGTIELNSNRTITLISETGMAYEAP